MIITRRNFLIGGAATVALVAATPVVKALDGLTITGEVGSYYRSVYDVVISCASHKMPGVHRILYGLYRGDSQWPMMQIGLHPMATMRWVAAPGGELIFTQDQAMRFEVDPSTSDPHFHIHSTDEHSKHWAETFNWKNDRLALCERVALDSLSSEPADYLT